MTARIAAAVILSMGALASGAQLPPDTARAAPDPAIAGKGGSSLLRQTMLVAVAAARASGTLKAVEGSLVYLGARYESATQGTNPASIASASQARGSAGGEAAGADAPMPPASAGTNGTPIDPLPPGTVVARAPAPPGSEAADSTATYVSGIALAPPNAPEAIKAAINAANTIVGRPYIWGGGHGSWYARGYDCSGAVSFALAGGGLLSTPLTSGQLGSWGEPGPGRWLTVYASPSHAYAVIAGLRWDTVGDASGTGPRWHLAGAPPDGFVARHAPGL